ncbi:MAG: NAD-dependent protein deacylase [Candidatus Omnitrophica bacterium]|nr:NAD-dependent protein deacylase [Candidatus Omnitrophota bacterium]
MKTVLPLPKANQAQNQAKISEIARLLKGCRNILFITGSGISAESGLPTYRGIGGLYDDKTTEEGIPIEMALAGEMLSTRPEITWKYLSQIEKNCRSATFNRAHEVIAQMERDFERVWVLTQNIDGFHRQAGSKNVIDIHGNLHNILCPACGWRKTIKDFTEIDIPPHCPKCNTIARPDVVFFGEMLPEDKLALLMRELDRGFDIYFSIGTTSVFPYIRHPMAVAEHLRRPTVEINPGETEISGWVEIKLPMGAAEALDGVWREYTSLRGGP